MRKIALDALDEAARLHVIKLFQVMISSADEAALGRFEVGIGNCIIAYNLAHEIVCRNCVE